MKITEADFIKKITHNSYEPSVDNDFNDPDQNYIRFRKGKRQFQIKGVIGNLYIVAVGLGPNGIGFKTVAKHINICDLGEVIKGYKTMTASWRTYHPYDNRPSKQLAVIF